MGEKGAKPFAWERPTEQARDEKRAALLRAAVKLFNERGFHATSLDDVAASVGVTKPVIYHYLGNKDRVLFECVRIGLAELQDAAAQARALPGDGLMRLEAFLRRYAEIVMTEFGRCVIRTGDEALAPGNRAEFRTLKREVDRFLRDMVEQAALDGSATVPDVKVSALMIAGALNWSARWYQADGALTPPEMASALVTAILAGIGADPPVRDAPSAA
ncbi:AcrR family transcriptional regulator [Sphingobium sp. OAS761]|uniref:TetR/AcrR family transcriptional regulator n=1 Tax=Sphingobium sp. OAS761 TaxID=2817901 RepID=UPI0020A00986|nr:TetR/AcrR family transcriptional regulator [Sphingobium sp. OAS761]MCP1472368.1 AcrR family transcriptional regulator [Sphingobium sp. OAS761]